MAQKWKRFQIKFICFVLIVLGILGAIFIDIDDYAHFKFKFKTDVSFHQLFKIFNIKTNFAPETAEGFATIWEIDVGQGKSILIKSESNAVLIDTGDLEYGNAIINFLTQKQIYKLDYLIITHPHADHMGGARKILENCPVSTVMLPKMSDKILPTSNMFNNFLNTLKEKEIPLVSPACGDKFNSGKVQLEILSEYDESFDLNNISIVTKITYGAFSFLSTGDIEIPAEQKILEHVKSLNCANLLRSNVLDVAHHGSKTSTTTEFLDATNPEIALISVGINDYGHPNSKTLSCLTQKNIPYFCTNKEGTLQINIFENYYSLLADGREIKKVNL
ncbi:MAG: MBL fold metallo-hydrolase [Oscillospiraceae bacterium]|jgi:competence protein ComEC|nr:MBL fold metallo-hydrolase [Oscillospiraceae bacterium]